MTNFYRNFYSNSTFNLEGTINLTRDVDKKVLLLLRDGRTLIGHLRSVDQYGNLVLQGTIERIHVGKEYGDIERGVFIIRGENLALMGEIDLIKENNLPLTQVSMEEILEAQIKDQENKLKLRRRLSNSFKEKGLNLLDDLSPDDFYF